MPTIEEVNLQIKNLGKAVDIFFTRKEINALPEILLKEEEIKGLTSGLMNGTTWLIVCTNRRILFLDKGLLWGLKQLDTPLEKINSIEHTTGLLMGSLAIWDGSSKMKVDAIKKDTLQPFVEAVNVQLDRVRNKHSSGGSFDVADQLKKLADLKQQGILTEDEFLAQKKKLLSA